MVQGFGLRVGIWCIPGRQSNHVGILLSLNCILCADPPTWTYWESISLVSVSKAICGLRFPGGPGTQQLGQSV